MNAKAIYFSISIPLMPLLSVEAKERPNIVFFLIDDLNYESLGCMGNSIVKTPAIDKLAEEGCLFTNAFVTTSISMASRASLFTGMHMCRHGVTQVTTPIPLENIGEVYPKELKKAGYNTGFIGKFGFRLANNATPDDWFDYFEPILRPPMIKTDGKGNEVHSTGLTTDYALNYIERQNERTPFCLSISYHAVHAEDGDHTPGRGHYPYMKERAEYYKRVQIPEPRLNEDSIFDNHPDFMKNSMNRERYFWRWDTPKKYQENVKSYYRMISDVDVSVRKVMTLLKKKGLDKNTIIVLMSDNGYYMGERGFAGKWSHYEESLRVPLLIYDPRVAVKGGLKCDEMVLNIDLPSTFLDWACADIPVSYQGKSIAELVVGKKHDIRNEFYCEHGSTVKTIPRWRGVRGKRYVYADYYDHNYEYLHDLENDPDELVNLATDSRYRSLLVAFRNKTKKYHKQYSHKPLHVENQSIPFLRNGVVINPILKGDYPDPTIVKTDSCWYMTHSSFEYTPGLLIWKSKDLLKWEPVTHALNKYVGSVYAPDLIFHDGLCYLYFAAKNAVRTGFSNWVVTSRHPEKGWGDPVQIPVGKIDPGHVVDENGVRYLFMAGGNRVRLREDGLAIEGKVEKVYDGWEIPGEWAIEGVCLEGPKLFRRNGYFYMISAEGGTAGPATSHMVVCARAERLDGPWENSPYNPMLHTGSTDEQWWSVGHGTVFQGKGDDWFIMYHGYEKNYYTLGRQTLMQPVRWTDDGWPIVDYDRKLTMAELSVVGNDSENEVHWNKLLSDTFEEGKPGVQWKFYKEKEVRQRCNAGNGSLILSAKGKRLADCSPMLFVAANNNYEMEVDMELKGEVTAGLTLFYDEDNNCALAFSAEGLVRFKFGRADRPTDCGGGTRMRLKMVVENHQVSWFYSTDALNWKKYPNSMEVSGMHHNTAGGFLSLLPGIFVYGEGSVELRDFSYRGLDFNTL